MHFKKKVLTLKHASTCGLYLIQALPLFIDASTEFRLAAPGGSTAARLLAFCGAVLGRVVGKPGAIGPAVARAGGGRGGGGRGHSGEERSDEGEMGSASSSCEEQAANVA